MKQFILNKEPGRDNIVRLEGSDYHYLVKVRRLAVGESFPALLPCGTETLVKILTINHNNLTGKCKTLSETGNRGCPLPPIILFQAMPKSDKMDLIVRQAAEGEITEIVPFISEYSVAKTSAKGEKFLRWERIIKEARQQSGSKTATSIREPFKLNELFEYWKTLKTDGLAANLPALGLLFHHQSLEQESLHGYLDSVPQVIVLAIGPEGGFSDTEVSLFLENGFKPFTIGDTILRTETAALYCAAAIRILLLERNSWVLKQKKI